MPKVCYYSHTDKCTNEFTGLNQTQASAINDTSFKPFKLGCPVISDELKHIIGAETTRKGILRVFEMFQHQQLNRRLVYVFLEGFLETMFPQYKFPELFIKLHSRSPRICAYTQKVRSLQKRWHSSPASRRHHLQKRGDRFTARPVQGRVGRGHGWGHPSVFVCVGVLIQN